MKKSKKLISIFLSLLMVLSLIPIGMMTASAATGGNCYFCNHPLSSHKASGNTAISSDTNIIDTCSDCGGMDCEGYSWLQAVEGLNNLLNGDGHICDGVPHFIISGIKGTKNFNCKRYTFNPYSQEWFVSTEVSLSKSSFPEGASANDGKFYIEYPEGSRIYIECTGPTTPTTPTWVATITSKVDAVADELVHEDSGETFQLTQSLEELNATSFAGLVDSLTNKKYSQADNVYTIEGNWNTEKMCINVTLDEDENVASVNATLADNEGVYTDLTFTPAPAEPNWTPITIEGKDYLYDANILTIKKDLVCSVCNDSVAQTTGDKWYTTYPVSRFTNCVAAGHIKEAPATPTPLTFTAEEAGATMFFKWKAGTDVKVKASSTNVKLGENQATGDWENYDKGTVITLPNVGDSVQFKATNIVTSVGDSYHFGINGKKIAASGDVTSLTNGVGGNVALTIDKCYQGMFRSCSSLTKAPNLPSTTLSKYCYDSMFSSCTSLTEALELPATELAAYCYRLMFSDCRNLTSVPELKATELANYCYQDMFNKCTGIKVVETTTASEATWIFPAEVTSSYWNTTMISGLTAPGTLTAVEAGKMYKVTPAPTHEHNSSAYGTSARQHWTKCTDDEDNNGTPTDHTWSNGQCSVCNYACLHTDMTTSDATCNICGKANPDYVAPTDFKTLEKDLKYDGTVTKLTKDYTRAKAQQGIAIEEGQKVVIDLNGHKIDGANDKLTSYGFIFVVDPGAELVITDSTDNEGVITGGTGIYDPDEQIRIGGVIYNLGTVTINGGTFTGNTATYGGVISNFGTLTINDGVFTENTVSGTGGVIDTSNPDSVILITGGTFTNNSANYGGVVENYLSPSCTIIGGTFTDNTALSNGGAIDNYEATLYIGGSVVIKDNKVGEEPNNFELESGTIALADTPFTEDAEIGATITAETDTLIAEGATLDTLSSFTSDDTTKMFIVENGALKLQNITDHNHTGGTATCSTQATCSTCGASYGNLASHSFATTWSSDTTQHWHAATCSHTTQKGDLANHSGGTATCTAAAVCSTCGASYGSANGHSYTTKASTTKATDATCTSAATYYVECDNCSSVSNTVTVSVGQPNGHSFETAWTKNTTHHWHAATCGHNTEKSGYAQHSYSSSVTTPATCTSAGVTTYTCTCGYTYTDTTAPAALGHSYTNYVPNNDATCTADGTKTATCNRTGCNQTSTITDTGTALGHSYTNYIPNNDATCTADGTKTATCDRTGCNQTSTITDTGSATGHSFATTWTYDEDAHWHAANCGHNTEKSDKADHSYGTEGAERYTCSVCDAVNDDKKADADATDLANAKQNAKLAIGMNTLMNTNEEVENIANKANEDIDNATTIEEVEEIKNKAIDDINNAKEAAEMLKNAKAFAKNRLTTKINGSTDSRLLDILNEYSDKIDNAASIAEAEALTEEAIAALDEIMNPKKTNENIKTNDSKTSPATGATVMGFGALGLGVALYAVLKKKED